MSREIESIELVLENLESVKIKREHIGFFEMRGITKSISRLASNSISEILTVNEVFLQICSKANNYSSYVHDWHDEKIKPFERLMRYKDIVAVEVNFKDGSSECIYVNWESDLDDYTNKNQSVAINKKTGDLYIVISEKENVLTYFDDYLKEEKSSYWVLYE